MLPDLEADILLWVQEVVHHLIVDLQVAHCHQTLGSIRCEALPNTAPNTETNMFRFLVRYPGSKLHQHDTCRITLLAGDT